MHAKIEHIRDAAIEMSVKAAKKFDSYGLVKQTAIVTSMVLATLGVFGLTVARPLLAAERTDNRATIYAAIAAGKTITCQGVAFTKDNLPPRPEITPSQPGALIWQMIDNGQCRS